MSKFKEGDTVRRVTYDMADLGMYVGHLYTVEAVSGSTGHIRVKGIHGWFDKRYFVLVQEAPSEQVLTPLEVAVALLDGKTLERYEHGVWREHHVSANRVSFSKRLQYRLKPRTICINGVDVPAPLIQRPTGYYIYCVNVGSAEVHALVNKHVTVQYCWATQEDAEKVLAAMLLPFKQLEGNTVPYLND